MHALSDALVEECRQFVMEAPGGGVGPEVTDDASLFGMRYFAAPLFGFAAADDEIFTALRAPEAVGEHFLLPADWLADAKTVISFFLPFTEQVKRSNARDGALPSPEWLYARIEGQAFVIELCRFIDGWLTRRGFTAVVPATDERMRAYQSPRFTSNWSERHVAYAAGLGTFGLSCGLITRQGMSGRFGSVVTTAAFAPTERRYRTPYEYCNKCGVCARRCPVQAISTTAGKNHQICSDYLDEMKRCYHPRYGCGKCQVAVPCESRVPRGAGKK